MRAVQNEEIQTTKSAQTPRSCFSLHAFGTVPKRSERSFFTCSSLFSCEVWSWRASATQNASLAVMCSTMCPRTVQRLPLSRQWRWWDNLWERKQDIFWLELGKEGGGRGGTLQLLPSISVNWKGLSPDSCWYFLMEISPIDRVTDGVYRHGTADTLWDNEKMPKVAICSVAVC